MNETMKELIAVGASVGAHCQPCLTYYVGQARKIGIGEDEIREAIAIGHQVEKGAMAAMRRFSDEMLSQDPGNAGGCCPPGGAGEGCCG